MPTAICNTYKYLQQDDNECLETGHNSYRNKLHWITRKDSKVKIKWQNIQASVKKFFPEPLKQAHQIVGGPVLKSSDLVFEKYCGHDEEYNELCWS